MGFVVRFGVALSFLLLGLSLLGFSGSFAQNKSAYLIVPYIELSEKEQTVFLKTLLPLLTLEGKLTNAGTRQSPWYCIEYQNAAQARSEKKNIGAVFNEYQIEFKTQISDSCAAG